jgi:hypothetical protein
MDRAAILAAVEASPRDTPVVFLMKRRDGCE